MDGRIDVVSPTIHKYFRYKVTTGMFTVFFPSFLCFACVSQTYITKFIPCTVATDLHIYTVTSMF